MSGLLCAKHVVLNCTMERCNSKAGKEATEKYNAKLKGKLAIPPKTAKKKRGS